MKNNTNSMHPTDADSNPNQIILFLDLWPSPAEASRPILAAKRLGLEVLLICLKATDEQIQAVDHIIEIDTYDFDLVRRAVDSFPMKSQIVGVAKWLDRSVELAALIASDLGLKSMTVENAKITRDKHLCKKSAANAGVATPAFAFVADKADLAAAAKTVGFPAILKPVSASASRYIFKVGNQAALETVLDDLLARKRRAVDPILALSPGFILEEFIDGRLVTIDGIAGADDIYFAGVIDHENTAETFLDFEHVFPAPLTQDQTADCLEAARRVLKSTGVRHTPFQIEGFLTENGFVFIEMAARTAGDYNSTHMIPSVLQKDYLADCILGFMGHEPNGGKDYVLAKNFFYGTRYKIVKSEGRFHSLNGLETVSRMFGFEHVFTEVTPGQNIAQPPDDYFSCRVASLFAVGQSYQEVKDRLKKMGDALTAQID